MREKKLYGKKVLSVLLAASLLLGSGDYASAAEEYGDVPEESTEKTGNGNEVEESTENEKEIVYVKPDPVTETVVLEAQIDWKEIRVEASECKAEVAAGKAYDAPFDVTIEAVPDISYPEIPEERTREDDQERISNEETAEEIGETEKDVEYIYLDPEIITVYEYEEVTKEMLLAELLPGFGYLLAGEKQVLPELSWELLDADEEDGTPGILRATFTIGDEESETDGIYGVIYKEELLGPGLILDREGPKLSASFAGESAEPLFVNYVSLGTWFGDHSLCMKTVSEDETVGISRETLSIFRDGEEEATYSGTDRKKPLEDAVLGEEKEFCFADLLGLEDEEGFSGYFTYTVEDFLGKRETFARQIVISCEEMHAKSSELFLETKTEPSRTVNGTAFYNTDVDVYYLARDSFAGIRSLSYEIGSEYKKDEDYTANDTRTDEVWENLTIHAAQNDRNDVAARIRMKDHIGYADEVNASWNIDVTAPVIDVTYEDSIAPLHEYYFREPRTAVVTITERNFDEADVTFLIGGENPGSVGIGGWVSEGEGNNRKHTCRVVFDADGDYTFSVEFTDMAGNKASYERTDHFVIDRTVPVMTVVFDNNEVRNELFYKDPRTAFIEIREHNFSPELIVVNEKGTPWKQSGDVWRMEVPFTEDGSYVLEISGEDLAGNPMEAYESDEFIIDRTKPEVKILSPRDQSASNGAVIPKAICSDEYYESGSFEVTLTGAARGTVKMNGEVTERENEAGFQGKDFPYEQEYDDFYTLTARGTDLAGNETEESVTFSVNRFGSVYVLGEETALLAGREGTYYTPISPKLVITEINVNRVFGVQVVSSCDGEFTVLEKGKDYLVDESTSEEHWHRYRYTVGEDFFEREGIYSLTISSEDEAGNVSDSRTGGAEMEFALDRTAPTILISGVEDGETYQESSRSVFLEVRDNIAVDSLKLIVNGDETVYPEEQLKALDGMIRLKLQANVDKQSIRAIAVDRTGNVCETEKREFLINNRIVKTPKSSEERKKNGKPVWPYVLWALSLGVISSGVIIWLMRPVKKKRKDK